MPMQPRPMAETAGPVEPSVRFSMKTLLEMAAGGRREMTRGICAFSIGTIRWTIPNSLFIISNNEGFRPARSRRFRGGCPHPQFPARGAGEPRIRLEPQPAPEEHGRAAWRPPDEPHHPP